MNEVIDIWEIVCLARKYGHESNKQWITRKLQHVQQEHHKKLIESAVLLNWLRKSDPVLYATTSNALREAKVHFQAEMMTDDNLTIAEYNELMHLMHLPENKAREL